MGGGEGRSAYASLHTSRACAGKTTAFKKSTRDAVTCGTPSATCSSPKQYASPTELQQYTHAFTHHQCAACAWTQRGLARQQELSPSRAWGRASAGLAWPRGSHPRPCSPVLGAPGCTPAPPAHATRGAMCSTGSLIIPAEPQPCAHVAQIFHPSLPQPYLAPVMLMERELSVWERGRPVATNSEHSRVHNHPLAQTMSLATSNYPTLPHPAHDANGAVQIASARTAPQKHEPGTSQAQWYRYRYVRLG